jgi:hypothetical protein
VLLIDHDSYGAVHLEEYERQYIGICLRRIEKKLIKNPISSVGMSNKNYFYQKCIVKTCKNV